MCGAAKFIMITQKRRFGDIGEENACTYLISKGYVIIERNHATKFGEIDIIARKRRKLVFVEVKTMRAGGGLYPEENITHKKLRKMQRTVQMYLAMRKISDDQQWQMDAISVLIDLSGNEATINHIEHINIF